VKFFGLPVLESITGFSKRVEQFTQFAANVLACPWPATCHPHPQDPFPHLSPSSFQHDKFMHRTDSSLGVKTLNLSSNTNNSSVSKRQRLLLAFQTFHWM
jgi:hypothetical protein